MRGLTPANIFYVRAMTYGYFIGQSGETKLNLIFTSLGCGRVGNVHYMHNGGFDQTSEE